MAVEMIPAAPRLALAGPEFPSHNSPPASHLEWCERFGLYCARQAHIAHKFDLPTRKWLRAAELAALAASIWRERVESRAAP